jgi:glycine/serine hydroxymethyltransferase
MDSQIQALIAAEYARQQNELELIASENYVSKEVMQTYGNVFTNKYSEGNPGKRYYGGQKWVDRMEVLTQHRALRMFGVLEGSDPDCMTDEGYEQAKKDLASASRGVNVQPLS